jgi:hypothetical protein
MIRAFGFLVAMCCWGFQLTRWLNNGMWPDLPLFPFIDQWLPSPFVVWLIEPRQWPEAADVVARALNVNAGIWIFIVAYLLQVLVPTSDADAR